MKPRVVAIIPAAGIGRRLGARTEKSFVLLGGKPMIYYALKALEDCGSVDAIIIAARKASMNRLEALIKKSGFRKVAKIVAGGGSRSESVKNCLDSIDSSFDIVLIHDGARPLVETGLIERSIRTARKFGACAAAVPESDTVKLSDENLFIKKTLDRNMVFRAQTPQAFRQALLKKAYSKKVRRGFTDDAGLVEALGARIKILRGSYRNIKITTREDLRLAEVLL